VALPLGAASVCLRPSFQALLAAESEIGSLARAIERAADGDVRLADLSALFWHCGGAGTGVTRATFEASLEAAGLGVLLPAYRALLARVFAGHG
jgi:phage tail protein X